MSDHRLEKSLRRFLAPPKVRAEPAFVLRRLRRSPEGRHDDLGDVVELSHCNKRIQLANDLTWEQRYALYDKWSAANPDTILVLERQPRDAGGVAIIGCSIVLPLRADDFDLIERAAMAVVNLSGRQICKPGEAFDVLLFDTWIMHFDYQDYIGHLWPPRHLGWANVLPLRHIALLWDLSRPVLLVAEPDSKSMQTLLQRISFAQRAKSAIGEPLLSIALPPSGDGPLGTAAASLLSRLRECAQAPLA